LRQAFERMPSDGEIVVSAGGLSHRHGAMFTGMSVSDTAASSTQAIQAELFEPAPMASANDALAPNLGNVNRLVETMAGHLSFKAGDAGTRFDILLPCAKQLKLVA
jgi:nitrogen-specific signal transduction histidine kinase